MSPTLLLVATLTIVLLFIASVMVLALLCQPDGGAL